jgi:hypothetical protein
MEPTAEQTNKVIAAQLYAGIDPYKSVRLPVAVIIGQQWIQGQLTQAEMVVAYQSLAVLCPAILAVPPE